MCVCVIAGPPHVWGAVPSSQTFRLGDTVKLDCPIRANPPPILEWLKVKTLNFITLVRFLSHFPPPLPPPPPLTDQPRPQALQHQHLEVEGQGADGDLQGVLLQPLEEGPIVPTEEVILVK